MDRILKSELISLCDGSKAVDETEKKNSRILVITFEYSVRFPSGGVELSNWIELEIGMLEEHVDNE